MKVLIKNRKLEVLKDSLKFSNREGSVGTCSLSAFALSSSYYIFNKGDKVDVFDDSEQVIFSGFISDISERLEYTEKIYYDLSIQDNNSILNKRIHAKAYVNNTVGEIVTDILNNILAEDGIVLGKIQATKKISKISFPYETVTEIFDKLITYDNYIYFINQYRELYFIPKDDYISNFTINNAFVRSGGLTKNISIQRSKKDYRNVQYLTGGRGTTSQTIIRKLDGNTKEIDVGYPIARKPRVYTDETNLGRAFIERTVGIKGLDDNKNLDFYWQYDNNTITHNENSDYLPNETFIKVEFDGLYDIVIKNTDHNEVLKQKKMDGTSGLNEKTEEVDLIGISVLMEYAKKNIDYKKQEEISLTFASRIRHYEVGMGVKVHLPALNIVNKLFYVSELSVNLVNDVMDFQYTLIHGTSEDSYKRLFKKEKKAQSEDIVGTVENTLVYKSFEKNWLSTENPNLFGTILYPSNALYPSNTLYPSMTKGNKLKYISLYKSGVEYIRYPITDEEENDGVIYSIAFIPSEAEGPFDGIAWVIGSNARLTLGTGTIIDKRNIVIEKVKDLESVQITRTDYKWE